MCKSEGELLSDWMPLSQQLSQSTIRPEHLVNPFCNILNCTSKTAKEYPDLFGKKTSLWRFLNSLTGATVAWARSCFYWPIAIPLNLPNKHVDVVIISHLTNINQLNEKTDFYFGDLAERLEDEGLSTHTVLINHARAGRQRSLSKGKSVLPAFLSPLMEASILLKLALGIFTFPRGNSVKSQRFHHLARLAQFGSRAIGDYRIGIMLSKFVHCFSPKVVIHTYEGHGWERVLATAIHKMDIPAHVFGYQHAVIFPGPKAILQHRGNAMPDHIFSTGEAAKKILVHDGEIPSKHFSILGSCKAVSTDSSPQFKATGACLIAPEGTLSEVMLMAGMGLDAARTNPEQQFVLRLHPVLPYQQGVDALAQFHPIPENFVLSQESLDEDLRRSSWLCYRGSTVSFQGILAGLRPIYLDPDQSVATNDPLPQDLAFRRHCVSGDEINTVISCDKSIPKPDQTELKQALAFAMSYLMPFNPDELIEKIKTL